METMANRAPDPIAIQNQAGITIDNHIGAAAKFYSHTEKGKEDFRGWLLQFEDKAGRLRWDDKTKVRNFIACQAGPARTNVSTLQSTASEEMLPKFRNDWRALKAWAMETYAIGGST